jgi:hypothetical protein
LEEEEPFQDLKPCNINRINHIVLDVYILFSDRCFKSIKSYSHKKKRALRAISSTKKKKRAVRAK